MPSRSRPATQKQPDLAAVARDAVVTFLHEHQADGTAPAPAPAPADGTAPASGADVITGTAVTLRATAEEMLAAAGPGALDPAGGPAGAEAVAWQAAAVSVATLDRIEAAAA